MTSTTQYMAALERANKIRLAAAATRREIHALASRDGALRVAELLDAGDARIASMPVGRLLRSIRAVGEVKVSMLLRAAGIATQDRRVDRLTSRQRGSLAEALRSWGLWPYSQSVNNERRRQAA